MPRAPQASCAVPRSGEGESSCPWHFIRRYSTRGCAYFADDTLGCREFAAEFLPSANAPDPIPVTRDLGLMLHDIEFGESNRPKFFEASLRDGVLNVPPWAEGEAAA